MRGLAEAGLFAIGGAALLVAKFGMPAFLTEGWQADEPEGYMSSSSPWSKNYEPSERYAPSEPAIHFRSCSEARGAGAAPIHRGEPGYARHLDRDGDGIACEPWRGR